jgi:hypothetical protein
MPSGDAAFKEIVANRALTVLRRLVKRGAVVKSGTNRNAQWVLAPIQKTPARICPIDVALIPRY